MNLNIIQNKNRNPIYNNPKDSTQKPPKYPKTLNILLNTRIRGFSKISYTPSMTVPGIKSDTVFFDPLIELNDAIASSIPTGYPPSVVFTQFFDKGEFESLLNRTVSSSIVGKSSGLDLLYSLELGTVSTNIMGRRYYDLLEATERGIIDKSIRVILNQLFKPNNNFYIQGEPYTIYNYNWTRGDWAIETKDFEEQFLTRNITSFGLSNTSFGLTHPYEAQMEEIAKKEWNDLNNLNPKLMRGQFYNQMSQMRKQTYEMTKKEKEVLESSLLTNPAMRSEIPEVANMLFGVHYTQEQALNLDPSTPNFVSDPISLSMIYNADRDYNTEMEKSNELKKKYEIYKEKARLLKERQDDFDHTYGLKMKRYDSEKVQVGGDGKSDALQQIQKNNTQWISLLQDEIRTQQIIQIQIKKMMMKMDTIESQISYPQDKKYPSWGQWEQEVKIYIKNMQTRTTTLKKYMQDNLNLSKSDKYQIIMQTQIEEIQYLLDMKEKETSIIQSRLQIFPDMLLNEQLDKNTILVLQNLLQQVNTIIDTFLSLLKEIVNSTQKNEDVASSTVSTATPRSVLQKKADFDNLILPFISVINNLKKRQDFEKKYLFEKEEYKKQFTDTVTAILNAQESFLSLCIDMYTILYSYFELQTDYVIAFVEFYDELLKVRTNDLIRMKRENTNSVDLYKYLIENKYIEFDIACYRSLLQNVDYINATKNLQVNISLHIKELKNSIDLKYTYREELEKWYDFPILLSLLQSQYDVYYQEVLLMYEKNQEIMWRILKEETMRFFSVIREDTMKKITTSYELLETYEKKYTLEQRVSFLNQLQISSKSIQDQNSLSYFSFLKTNKKDTYTEQRKIYMALKQSQVIAYEMITTYARISSKDIGRQLSYLTVKKNKTILEENKYKALGLYYDNVKKNIYQIKGLIPFSIYWDVKKIDSNIDILITQNKRYIGDVYDRTGLMNKEMEQLTTQYQKAVDVLIPEISEGGIMKTCNTITIKELNEETEEIPLNQNEELKRLFFSRLYYNKDTRLEFYFKKQLKYLLKENFIDIETSKNKNKPFYVAEQMKQTEGWKITKSRSFLQCIADALNGQMQMLQTFTLNKYACRPYLDEYDVSDVNKQGDGYEEGRYLPFSRANEYLFTEAQLKHLILDHLKNSEYGYFHKSILLFHSYLLIPYIKEYKSNPIYAREYPDLLKKIENKIELEWNKYRYFYNGGEETFVVFINNITKATTGSYEDFLESKIKTNEEFITSMRMNKDYNHYDKFAFIIEKVLKIKIVTMNTYTKNLLEGFIEENTANHPDDITFDKMNRPIYFINNPREDTIKNTIEQGIIFDNLITGSIRKELKDSTGKELEYIRLLYFLEMLQAFFLEKYNFYKEKTPHFDIMIQHCKLLLYNLYEIIQNLKINGLFLMKTISQLQSRRGNVFFGFTLSKGDLKRGWDAIFSENRIDENTNISKLNDPNISEWNNILIRCIVDIDKKNIEYKIKRNNYDTVMITAERMLDWEQPILNINEPFYYYTDDSLFGRNMIRDAKWDYIFLLCDNPKDAAPVYNNICNEKKPHFVYTFEEIPPLFLYLIFKDFFKINQLEDKRPGTREYFYSYYQYNNQCLVKMLEYEKKYKENRPSNILEEVLPRIKYATPTEMENLWQENKEDLEILDKKSDGEMQMGGMQMGGMQMGGAIENSVLPSSYLNTNRNQNMQSPFFQKDESNLSYYVIVDLELYPGKDAIPFKQKLVLGCQSRYEKIRQSWAKMFGLIYRPSEMYIPGYVPPGMKKGGSFTKRMHQGQRGFFRKTRRSGI